MLKILRMFRFIFSFLAMLISFGAYASEPLYFFSFKSNNVSMELCPIEWPSNPDVFEEDVFLFKPRAKSPVYIFTNGMPVQVIISDNDGKSWSEPITVVNSVDAKVTSAVMHSDGSLTVYFHDDKGVILSASSSDGLKWNFPRVAFRHNTIRLEHAMVSRASRNRMYALMHEKDTRKILYSMSPDGVSWSYPEYLEVQPDKHLTALSVRDNGYYIICYDDLNVQIMRSSLRNFGKKDKYAEVFTFPRGSIGRYTPFYMRIGRDSAYIYD